MVIYGDLSWNLWRHRKISPQDQMFVAEVRDTLTSRPCKEKWSSQQITPQDPRSGVDVRGLSVGQLSVGC